MPRNFESLRRLWDLVSDTPESRLHMDRVVGVCGTLCVVGIAALDPWFRENTCLRETRPQFRPDGSLSHVDFLPDGFRSAFANALGVTTANVERLCFADKSRLDPEAKPSKQDVLANIDLLLAGKNAQPYARPKP